MSSVEPLALMVNMDMQRGGAFGMTVKTVFPFLLALILCNSCWTAEPPPVPTEEVDPDVLRKVGKLVKGTLAEDTKEREAAWTGLKNMGNLAVPGLLGLYRQKETTPEMVGSIIIALGDSKDPRSGPALVELLSSKDATVRRDACRSLGDTMFQQGRAALEKLASDEKENSEVRLFAAVAAAKLGSERGLAVLQSLLKSEKPEIRSRAVFALGKFGGREQIKTIAGMLSDASRDVREDTVEALRLLKNKDAYGSLVKATEDGDYKIRSQAMDALQELTGAKIENTPKAWQEWWAAKQNKAEPKKE